MVVFDVETTQLVEEEVEIEDMGAGARGPFRHVVSPTAPAPFAEVRVRVAKRPEKRSLGS